MRSYFTTLAAVALIAIVVWATAALCFSAASGKRPAAPHHASCSEGCRYA